MDSCAFSTMRTSAWLVICKAEQALGPIEVVHDMISARFSLCRKRVSNQEYIVTASM